MADNFIEVNEWPQGVGSEEDNMLIDFGDSAMNCKTIELARAIANDYLQNNLKLIDLCNKYGRKRPQITMFIYAVTTLPEALLWYYLNKHVGLKPLVELHKEFGNVVLEVINALYKEKAAAGDTTILKKPYIVKAILAKTGKSIDSGKNEQSIEQMRSDSVKSTAVEGFTDATLADCRSSVSRIRRLLHEAAEFNQDPSSLRINPQTFRQIFLELNSLEQCFDDGDISPEQQGDPTDQSNGSYVFANMVDAAQKGPIHSSEEFAVELEDTCLDYEDFSQDPSDYYQDQQ